jgi:hypothetical protein
MIKGFPSNFEQNYPSEAKKRVQNADIKANLGRRKIIEKKKKAFKEIVFS